MSGVKQMKGGSMRDAKKRIASLGVLAAQQVASRAAPTVSQALRADFDAGRTAYGSPRPVGARGALTLVHTGATRATLGFSSQGTVLRAVLSTRWAKYLVGKYRILPIGDRTAIPAKWKHTIDAIVHDVLSSEWRRAA